MLRKESKLSEILEELAGNLPFTPMLVSPTLDRNFILEPIVMRLTVIIVVVNKVTGSFVVQQTEKEAM